VRDKAQMTHTIAGEAQFDKWSEKGRESDFGASSLQGISDGKGRFRETHKESWSWATL